MSDTSSKLEEEHVEKGVCCPAISPHDALETRRILRKVDYRLIPLLTVMYLISFIDRANSEHR